jgi:hypothetical protein
VASALYFLAIAAALVHLDTRITRLPDAELASGLKWTRARGWVDEPAGRLLCQALEKIGPPEKGVSS